MLLCGVDYGSKLAGTTVICALDTASRQMQIECSAKNADADRFLLDYLQNYPPDHLFLDAPLSLPGIYRGLPNCTDYFYRLADSQLKAMSPMFLGGLTARAMQLAAQLKQLEVSVSETYPRAQAIRLGLEEKGYKKDPTYIEAVLDQILKHYPDLQLNFLRVTNWHQVDALLALVTAVRFKANQHATFGSPEEGLIFI